MDTNRIRSVRPKGKGIQRVIFLFWHINGREGYVLAKHPYPHTIYEVHILGERLPCWMFPGDTSVTHIKATVESYLDLML